MENAATPQNDRELLLKLNGNVEILAKSIDNFSITLKDLEERKIGSLESRIEAMENKWVQVTGGWKLVLAIWALITAIGLVAIVKWISK